MKEHLFCDCIYRQVKERHNHCIWRKGKSLEQGWAGKEAGMGGEGDRQSWGAAGAVGVCFRIRRVKKKLKASEWTHTVTKFLQENKQTNWVFSSELRIDSAPLSLSLSYHWKL